MILAGDHIYKMDYGTMLAAHAEQGADVTVGCIEVPVDEARAFGVMDIDNNNRVIQFHEKPDKPQSIPGKPGIALASMGIYVFNTELLRKELIRDRSDPNSTHDFGRDIIPKLIERGRVCAFPFRDEKTGVQAYWRDVRHRRCVLAIESSN